MKRLLPLSMLLVGILLALALWHSLERRDDGGDVGGAGPAIAESRSAEDSGGGRDVQALQGQGEEGSNGCKVGITDYAAVEIAKREIKKPAEIFYDQSGKILVERKENSICVTFPDPPLPPHVRGADFAARVYINSESGEVIRVVVGR